MKLNRNILIAGGGTGGHLFPGIALAKVLRKRDIEPIFVVKKNDPSLNIFIKENFRFYEIPIIGFKRSISLRNVYLLYYVLKSIFESLNIIKIVRPYAIVGMGGYISFPVVLSGYIKRIPRIIHEQNYIPGLSNKFISFFANKIAVSFRETEKYFNQNKVIFTGNPVREEIFAIDPNNSYYELNLDKNKYTIFIFGGSQGATRINRIMIETLNSLEQFKDRFQFIHITGEKDFEFVKNAYSKSFFVYKIFKFMYDIGKAYSVADLVICRSGATTVAELKALEKNAILIPYPYATANHQEYNSLLLTKSGQASMISENKLNADLLSHTIINYYNSCPKNIRMIGIPPNLAQNLLADSVLDLIRVH